MYSTCLSQVSSFFDLENVHHTSPVIALSASVQLVWSAVLAVLLSRSQSLGMNTGVSIQTQTHLLRGSLAILRVRERLCEAKAAALRVSHRWILLNMKCEL
jgi:hypothetical protein